MPRKRLHPVKIVQYEGGHFYCYDSVYPGPPLDRYIVWDLGWDWLGKRDYLIVGYQKDARRYDTRRHKVFTQDWVVAIRGHHLHYYVPNGRWTIPYKAQTIRNWTAPPIFWNLAQTDPRRFLAALKLYEVL